MKNITLIISFDVNQTWIENNLSEFCKNVSESNRNPPKGTFNYNTELKITNHEIHDTHNDSSNTKPCDNNTLAEV